MVQVAEARLHTMEILARPCTSQKLTNKAGLCHHFVMDIVKQCLSADYVSHFLIVLSAKKVTSIERRRFDSAAVSKLE